MLGGGGGGGGVGGGGGGGGRSTGFGLYYNINEERLAEPGSAAWR